MKVSKTAILPIISVVCLCIGSLTGHAISADLQDHIASIATIVITSGVSVWGIIKNHKKEEEK